MPFPLLELPRLATAGGNPVAEPPSGTKDDGYSNDDQPGAPHFNWLLRQSYLALKAIVGTVGRMRALNWTAQTVAGGFTDIFYAITWSDVDRLWCAVGDSGEIQTSPDGITWTARTADGSYSGIFLSVAHDGAGLFVAVGTSGEIQTSPDGITWTARTADGSYSDTFQSVAYDGSGLWCAVGDSGEIQTSPDGITWTARTADGSYSGTFNRVYHDGSGLWCAVGSGPQIQTSPDGTTWTARTSDLSSTLRSVSYGNGQWACGGNDGDVQTSPDGITWTEQTLDSSGTSIYSIAHDGHGLWVAHTIGAGGVFVSDDDGVTWESHGDLTGIGASGAYGLAFGNGHWALSGDGGSISTGLRS